MRSSAYKIVAVLCGLLAVAWFVVPALLFDDTAPDVPQFLLWMGGGLALLLTAAVLNASARRTSGASKHAKSHRRQSEGQQQTIAADRDILCPDCGRKLCSAFELRQRLGLGATASVAGSFVLHCPHCGAASDAEIAL